MTVLLVDAANVVGARPDGCTDEGRVPPTRQSGIFAWGRLCDLARDTDIDDGHVGTDRRCQLDRTC